MRRSHSHRRFVKGDRYKRSGGQFGQCMAFWSEKLPELGTLQVSPLVMENSTGNLSSGCLLVPSDSKVIYASVRMKPTI
jgi:hypothetical protein